MSRKIVLLGVLAASSLLAACNYTPAPVSSEQGVAQEQERQTTELQAQIGLPRIANGTEKKLATKIEEMRDDPNLITYAYLQGIDGKLRCFGKGVGFGLPYSTQITAPTKKVNADCGQYRCDQDQPQAEPNGLYMPTSADATWYMLIDPKTGKSAPVYVEPHLTVSPFPIKGPSVADPCVD